jgi:cytochrome c
MNILALVLLALQGGSHRPRDPWVFRCVLDQRPRMVTLALSDEMWVAYDATHCGLYKAWKGGVHFDGPVYTTVHGPQPTTQGTSYVDGIDGDVWTARAGDQEVSAAARWKGYRFNGDHVALEYEIALQDGRKLSVQESPEFVTPEQMMDDARIQENGLVRGRPGFLRNFLARDVPEDVEVSVRTPIAKGKPIASPVPRVQDGIVLVRLSRAQPQASLALFFEPIPDPPKEAPK